MFDSSQINRFVKCKRQIWKMMTKKMSLLLTGMLLCLAPDMKGNETDGRIKGIVMDGELGGPLEFVTVQVKAKGSDKILQGAVTGSDGNYSIGGLKKGEYVVTFSYIGYADISKNITISNNSQTLNLGELTLEEDANQLGEVEIVAKKPQMRFELDRKVFDATQDIASEGGSASDLLANIPSVEVDNEGSVSLRGNSSVTVWINGKASGLTADNQADILEMMPAEDIKQVEVITNPSAKYSPEGTAGIINIILKDDRKPGYYGSVKAGADTDGGYQASGNINYSSSKVDAYANLSYRNREMKGGGITSRENTTDNSFLDQTNRSKRQHNNWFGRIGATWHITKSDDLAFNMTGMTGGGDNNESIHYISTDKQKNTVYTSDRTTDGNSDMKMYNLELNYLHKFSENSNIDLTVSNNQWRNDGLSIYEQSTRYTDTGLTDKQEYQTQENNIRNKNWEVQADYTNKISDASRIEAGYKGTFQRESSPVDTYSGTTATDIEQDQALYNRFLYNQDVHALYMTYGGKWNNLSYQAGLRGEYWRVDTRSLDFDQEFNGKPSETFEKDYFKLFPSAFISYALPKNNEIQVNYTRRLRRPWGGQLNSFRNISDASNISFGNPELTPEYSHSFELNYKKNIGEHTVSATVFHRSRKDKIERLRVPYEAGVTLDSMANVGHDYSTGIELSGQVQLTRWWNVNLNGSLYHYKVKNQYKTGGENETSTNYDVMWNNSFDVFKYTRIQVDGNFVGPSVTTQGRTDAFWYVNLAVRQQLMNRKLAATLSFRDVFNSARYVSKIITSDLQSITRIRPSYPLITLTLSYTFNNFKAKSSQKKEDHDLFEGTNH